MRDGVRAACDIRELTCVMGFYFLCTSNDIISRAARFTDAPPGSEDLTIVD